jgi:hypothetical protein
MMSAAFSVLIIISPFIFLFASSLPLDDLSKKMSSSKGALVFKQENTGTPTAVGLQEMLTVKIIK